MWIPHSTVKIHGISSDAEKSNYDLKKRFEFELDTINFINKTPNCFVGVIGKFITKHLITEYSLNRKKSVNIYNGELIKNKSDENASVENQKLFSGIQNKKVILLSFGRAEEYKNLEATMYLGEKINENIKAKKRYNGLPTVTSVVIAQSYYKEQPILLNYKKTATATETTLFVDPPWNFPHYILNNFSGFIIVLVPSEKEIMGLVINEIRNLPKANILIVANNIDGLKEQITTKKDGLLIDFNTLNKSANQILDIIQSEKKTKKIRDNSYKTLLKKYDFEKNFKSFFKQIGIDHE